MMPAVLPSPGICKVCYAVLVDSLADLHCHAVSVLVCVGFGQPCLSMLYATTCGLALPPVRLATSSRLVNCHLVHNA